MENTANRIDLRGELVSLPTLSHENHGQRFYRFYLDVARLSGVCDRLPVIAPASVLDTMDLSAGQAITVGGQLRSYNERTAERRHLLVFAYAQTLRVCDEEPWNEVSLTGTLCREPVFRRTPLGRYICDVMLAVGRTYARTDYLPCILWGRNAREAAQAQVGDRLELSGRFQSRTYTKLLDTGPEQRTAYEISALESRLVEDVCLACL